MGKIWVEIVPSVSADGDEAKAALTKSVKDKIEKEMCKRMIAGLPSNFSNKDGDKPKDKRDDYAARAVRLVMNVKINLETKGSKRCSSMSSFTPGPLSRISTVIGRSRRSRLLGTLIRRPCW